MQSSTYSTPIEHGPIVVDGAAAQPSLFNDSDLQLERESRARSGNYLETVATELENLTNTIDDTLVAGQIESLIQELLYVHERYELVKKTSSQFSSRLHS